MEIRFSSLPKFAKGYNCVILIKAIFVDQYDDEIITDELTYTWQLEEDDDRVLCWIGDSFRELGQAHDLIEAIKIALEDLNEFVNEFYPKKVRIVVQD